jgi:hypothetical protein
MGKAALVADISLAARYSRGQDPGPTKFKMPALPKRSFGSARSAVLGTGRETPVPPLQSRNSSPPA